MVFEEDILDRDIIRHHYGGQLVNAKVTYGPATGQTLAPKPSKTLQDYADNNLNPYILQILESVKRINVVWDFCCSGSLDATCEKGSLASSEGRHSSRGGGNKKLSSLATGHKVRVTISCHPRKKKCLAPGQGFVTLTKTSQSCLKYWQVH